MRIRFVVCFVGISLFVSSWDVLFAHCDTMDGPVVTDAQKALDRNNINYVLKWIQPLNETEVKNAFELVMKVRVLSPDAKQLADHYFFETVVRLHRGGEGVPYTGIKPSGTAVDEKILAADKSIESGNLSPLAGLVPREKHHELKERFDKVMSLKNFDVNNVQVGREYIEAYVQFFHFAEGEEEGHHPGHTEENDHLGHLPWILSGTLLLSSTVLAFLYFRKK